MREQTIHIERAGATLAEVPVFDGGPYPSTVMAEEDTAVFFLAKEDVRRLLLSNPEAALAALGILATRLRNGTSLVEHLTLQDVTQRLAAMLIEEAKRIRWSTPLMLWSLLLLHLGCALRVMSEPLAYENYWNFARKVLPVSAIVELTAVALFAVNIMGTLLRPQAPSAFLKNGCEIPPTMQRQHWVRFSDIALDVRQLPTPKKGI